MPEVHKHERKEQTIVVTLDSDDVEGLVRKAAASEAGLRGWKIPDRALITVEDVPGGNYRVVAKWED